MEFIINKLTNFMEQSPSWEANKFSGSQEISHILWNPEVRHRIYKSPPLIPILSFVPKDQAKSNILWNISYHRKLLQWRVSVAPPTSKMEDHPFSAARDCVFNMSAVTWHIWSSLSYPKPEDTPCCGDRNLRTCHVVVTGIWGRAMLWWQEPTNHFYNNY
jgi:hypothetical protein